MGPFTYESRQIGSVVYFLLKKGANHVPGSAEKGAIRHAHMPYIGSYCPTPSREGGAISFQARIVATAL